MQAKKKLTSLLLSLCMVLGMLPMTVFAAGQYVPENPRWSAKLDSREAFRRKIQRR